ncbi:hypothetical protein B0H66DRAFT_631721 [Apodospora peruviana]|uniref:Uncharacterized protein n=1 Tax=Apodospora peruviana TaxID=516989 RepID=A0AAE0HTY5_9PEZI|nr:hypothetical protein B0H66DRAFT_631721 [Apodospora peruviana]
MKLAVLLYFPALALGSITANVRRPTPSCPNMDLAAIALDMAQSVDNYWETLPDVGLDAATKVDMHDLLLAAMLRKYPDPCIRGALEVAIDDFFTSDALDKDDDDLPDLDARSLGLALDPRGRGLKIKCGKKCKKCLKKVVGTVFEVLTAGIVAQPVCSSAGAAAGFATDNPAVGYLTYFVCMDQVRQEREKNEKRDKFFTLRSSAEKRPLGGVGEPDRILLPDGDIF